MEQITGTKPEEVIVDRGYRGHEVTDSQVFISGQKRGMNAMLSCTGHNIQVILRKIKIFVPISGGECLLASSRKNQCRSSPSGETDHWPENWLNQVFQGRLISGHNRTLMPATVTSNIPSFCCLFANLKKAL